MRPNARGTTPHISASPTERSPDSSGTWVALDLVAVLTARVVAIDNLPALVILAPAAAGAVVAFTWPPSRIAALAAVILISGTAVFGLIGGWGYLFVPSIALLILASTRPNAR